MIHVKNLTVSHNGRILVDHINFCIEKGEKVVLLGQSGSGKSLTSLALMHLLPQNLQSTGEILYDGNHFSPSLRGKFLGMVMQSPANCFDNAFTVGTLFRDACKAHLPKEQCTQEFYEQCIQKVGLENPRDILNSFPFQLSGGMLQRIMIALCHALQTALVIADEATSDIDCLAEKEIIDLLLKNKNSGQSLLLITHSIKTACAAADRILFMHEGKILDMFPVREIHSPNRHPILKTLLADNAKICKNSWGVNFYV